MSDWKSVLKRFLRDYLTAAAAFHGPILILFGALTLYVRFLPSKSTSIFYILNGTIPWMVSLWVFRRACVKWTEPPSPFLFFLGTWITGPLVLAAAVYYGYVPGLFILTFVYLILQPVKWIRKKVSGRSFWTAITLSFFFFALFLGLTAIWPEKETGGKKVVKWEIPKPSFKFMSKMPKFR